MTVDELYKALAKIRKLKNGGQKEVKLQIVDGGVTFAQPVTECVPMNSYDGHDVWIYTGKTELPAWL